MGVGAYTNTYQTWCSKTSLNSTPLTTRQDASKLTCNNSDYSGATSKLPKILLNGNNICMASSRVSLRYLADFLIPPAAHPRWHAWRRLMIHRFTSFFHSFMNDQQFTDRPPHIRSYSQELRAAAARFSSSATRSEQQRRRFAFALQEARALERRNHAGQLVRQQLSRASHNFLRPQLNGGVNYCTTVP